MLFLAGLETLPNRVEFLEFYVCREHFKMTLFSYLLTFKLGPQKSLGVWPAADTEQLLPELSWV